MRYSKMFIPTMKEDPKEAEILSHRLMLRAGFIRKLASGVYTWLPLGLKSLKKVENIIRQEDEPQGCTGDYHALCTAQGTLGREWKVGKKYGKELLRIRDRNDRELCLGPTHEEVVTDLVRREVKSYRELPLILYQIQTKFRDEIRPRFGVMRSREFSMKDAYSFDIDEASAEKSYMDMYDAYMRIFERIRIQFQGCGGGYWPDWREFSHEFIVLADTGEDTIISCGGCGYAANLNVQRLALLTGGATQRGSLRM